MLVSDIIKNIDVLELFGQTDKIVSSIVFDSRNIVENCVFIATKGTKVDGHKFINPAIYDGASTIICEQFPDKLINGITYIKVQNSLKALGLVASNFYNNPSKKIKLIGVTGTNGKTTIATLLYKMFKSAGYKVGLLSTVKNYINDTKIKATHTTPDAVQINKLLNKMVEVECDYCFMEVSSHAIHQHRIEGLEFKIGVFTNITHDHLDYHKTFKEYINAKKAFFDNLDKNAIAITNSDDKNGLVMLQNTKAKQFTYSLKSASNFKAKILEKSFDGTLVKIQNSEVWINFIGGFNVYNLLAVYAVSTNLGIEHNDALVLISKLFPVEGRFQNIKSKTGITAIIDYAHTPDALLNVINTINELKSKSQTLITVVGAGGNRDKTKRPEMAEIASKLSDKVIFTSDNPRNENPDDIINDMIKGVSDTNENKVVTITDRKSAIKTACMMSKANDIILIAGKGHENYQEINGVKHHFDDKEEVLNIFNKLNI